MHTHEKQTNEKKTMTAKHPAPLCPSEMIKPNKKNKCVLGNGSENLDSVGTPIIFLGAF